MCVLGDVSFAEGIGMCVCVMCVAAEDLKALKQRLKSAEEEATILRQTLDATSRATQRDLDEIAALRSENEALRTHQGTLQKVGRRKAAIDLCLQGEGREGRREVDRVFTILQKSGVVVMMGRC